MYVQVQQVGEKSHILSVKKKKQVTEKINKSKKHADVLSIKKNARIGSKKERNFGVKKTQQ